MTKSTFGFAAALVLVGTSSLVSTASAQVIIQGEVTVQQQQQGYTQPQPYGYQPQPVQPVYGAAPVYGQGGSPQPARYIHHADSLPALWVPGIIALGVGWLGGALIATYATSDCSGFRCPDFGWAGYQWIPVIGPWLALGLGNGRDWEPLSYVTGIVEDVGLLLFILGLVIRDEWDEPVYAFGEGPNAPALFLTANGARLTF